MSSPGGEPAAHEVAELRPRRPLPRARLDVAVGEDEPTGDGLQRVDRGVGVLGGLQAVRPVDGRRHPGVEGLDRGQQVARVDVLAAGTSCRARGSTRRSTGSGSSRRRSRASPSATCAGACRSFPASRCRRRRRSRSVPSGTCEAGPDGLDPLADDEDVGVAEHGPGRVHGQDGAAAGTRSGGPPRAPSVAAGLGHGVLLVLRPLRRSHGRTSVRTAVTARPRVTMNRCRTARQDPSARATLGGPEQLRGGARAAARRRPRLRGGRRARASTCSRPSARPAADDPGRGRRARPAWPGRRPAGSCGR